MSHATKTVSKAKPDQNKPEPSSSVSQARRANRLKDEVYREMLLMEVHRPGAEMGLALALLQAIVQSESLAQQQEFRNWLKTICPVGLRMIEVALGKHCKCDLEER